MVLIQEVWDLFEGKHMFTERQPSRDASTPAHIARMIALLGPPPIDLIKRGQFSTLFFDEEGKFIIEASALPLMSHRPFYPGYRNPANFA
jgi:hypothetical protein